MRRQGKGVQQRSKSDEGVQTRVQTRYEWTSTGAGPIDKWVAVVAVVVAAAAVAAGDAAPRRRALPIPSKACR